MLIIVKRQAVACSSPNIFYLFLNPNNFTGLEFTFHKYHGTGNDFILIDLRRTSFRPGQEIISRLCGRRFGIGADGLILLDKEPGYDFRMIFYNSDGLETSMCGNGGRCAVAYADFLSQNKSPVHFLAIDGEHTGEVLRRDGSMSEVLLTMNDVLSIEKWGNDFVLDTGSPHLVRFVPEVTGLDVRKEGRELRNHADFQSQGINVNFVKKEGDTLFIRTYERGVEDETLSCGTGVTASVLAYASREGIGAGEIPVSTPGGKLKVYFKAGRGGFSDIRLEGPAVRVFEGHTTI